MKELMQFKANLKHRCGRLEKERRMELNYYFNCNAIELFSFLESHRAPGGHAEYIHRNWAGLMDLVLLVAAPDLQMSFDSFSLPLGKREDNLNKV